MKRVSACKSQDYVPQAKLCFDQVQLKEIPIRVPHINIQKKITFLTPQQVADVIFHDSLTG